MTKTEFVNLPFFKRRRLERKWTRDKVDIYKRYTLEHGTSAITIPTLQLIQEQWLKEQT